MQPASEGEPRIAAADFARRDRSARTRSDADKESIRAAMRSLREATGAAGTLGVGLLPTGPIAFARVPVADESAASKALGDVAALVKLPGFKTRLEEARTSRPRLGKTVVENLPGDVQRLRLGKKDASDHDEPKKADAGDKKSAGKKGDDKKAVAASNDPPSHIDVLWLVQNGFAVAALGSDRRTPFVRSPSPRPRRASAPTPTSKRRSTRSGPTSRSRALRGRAADRRCAPRQAHATGFGAARSLVRQGDERRRGRARGEARRRQRRAPGSGPESRRSDRGRRESPLLRCRRCGRSALLAAVTVPLFAFLGCGGDGKEWVKSLPAGEPVQQPAGWTNEPPEARTRWPSPAADRSRARTTADPSLAAGRRAEQRRRRRRAHRVQGRRRFARRRPLSKHLLRLSEETTAGKKGRDPVRRDVRADRDGHEEPSTIRSASGKRAAHDRRDGELRGGWVRLRRALPADGPADLCFERLEARRTCPSGRGATRSEAITPLRSVAVDATVIPLGTARSSSPKFGRPSRGPTAPTTTAASSPRTKASASRVAKSIVSRAIPP